MAFSPNAGDETLQFANWLSAQGADGARTGDMTRLGASSRHRAAKRCFSSRASQRAHRPHIAYPLARCSNLLHQHARQAQARLN